MSFTLPDLPYAHDALQPYMSKETLEYHHDKHHLAYVNNGNNLLKGSEWEGKSLEEIVKGSFGKNAGLFNNAGQHYNHLHFWRWMKPNGGGAIPGKLEKKIIEDLGSVEKMKEDFIQAGVTQFGSGWSWLAVKDGKIVYVGPTAGAPAFTGPSTRQIDLKGRLMLPGFSDTHNHAYLRTENLSCVRADGATLEVRIQGSVYGEDGKVGMRGRLVTKQGQMLANALMAGVVSGIGQGIATASTWSRSSR